MDKFKYRFQSIEDVKEKVKKNSEKEFAVAVMKVNEKQSEIELILKEIDDSYNDVKVLNPKEMVFLEKYRESLKQKLKKKEDELSALIQAKENKQTQLTQHHKEHKVFVKLKEKQLAQHISDQKKLEQKSIDEIANQKFNNK